MEAPPDVNTTGRVEKPNPNQNPARGKFTGQYVTKLTEEVIEDISQAMRAGGSPETAASFARIGLSTFRQWLKEGRIAEGTVGPHDEQTTRKIEMAVAIEEALADFKLSLTGGIFQHGRDSWQAWAWLAERRFPDEFGRRQRIEHGNVEGEAFRIAPAMFDPSALTDEELQQVRSLLAKAQPDREVIEHPLRVIEGGQ